MTDKQRITILLADDLVQKCRDYQAKTIKQTKETCSFSSVIEMCVAQRFCK